MMNSVLSWTSGQRYDRDGTLHLRQYDSSYFGGMNASVVGNGQPPLYMLGIR